MAQKPQAYAPKLKFRLALEVLGGGRSEVELGRIYGVHHTTISKWKRQFLEHGVEVFGGNKDVERHEKKIAELERLVGQKEVAPALLKTSWPGAEGGGEARIGRGAPTASIDA